MAVSYDRIFKVSELTAEIKTILESAYPVVAVQGEISNFRPSSTGHYYFTLKDRDAIISAVMFKNRALRLSFLPHDGALVLVRGSLSVYPGRGTYQIICDVIEKAGEGDILLMLEERKKRLAAEGLFDGSRKKPLPPFPRRIAIITSPTGAAVRDILKVLKRRNAGIHVVILPAPVQGDGAESIIAAQIRRVEKYRLGDVIIVGRGGGSLEDLLPFSSEEVVRAIADSKIPVISAVGHETDTTLADFAADYRAPTPSAAAEAVSRVREDLLRHVEVLHADIEEALSNKIERVRLLLRRFTSEDLERQVRVLLQPYFFRLDDAKEKLVENIKNRLVRLRHRTAIAAGTVEACSPYEVLKRGYSIVSEKDTRRVVLNSESLSPGRVLSIRFYKGEADAAVQEVRGNQEF
jgi:exodeoxyribonuclease VII large subunit